MPARTSTDRRRDLRPRLTDNASLAKPARRPPPGLRHNEPTQRPGRLSQGADRVPLGDAGGRRRACLDRRTSRRRRLQGGAADLLGAGDAGRARTCSRPSAAARRIWSLPATPTSCRPATRRAGRTRRSPAEVADGLMYGRGAVDMKGGIACVHGRGARPRRRSGHSGRHAVAADHRRRGRATRQRHGQGLDWAREQGHTFDAAHRRRADLRAKLGDMIKIGRRGRLSARSR